MYYYDPDKRSSRRAASVAALLYALVWVVMMWLVVFDFERDEEEPGNGLLINFGDVAQAAPGGDPPLSEPSPQAAVPSSQSPDSDAMLTQPDPEAPEVQQSPKPESPAVSNEQRAREAEEPPQAPAREVNRRALFPGRTVGSASASEGSGEGLGNQGEAAGTPDGSHEGTGAGTSGEGFDLAGRQLVGLLPKPQYAADDAGKVVVQITVDAQGRVTGATFRSRGSTTQNSALVEAALKAARQARFTASEGSDLQTGTITYIFKMN